MKEISYKKENNFSTNRKHCIVRNSFIVKIILIWEKYCLEVIQSSGKSKRVLPAWTEVYHQFFGGWEIYRRMHDVYRKGFFESNFYKWVSLLAKDSKRQSPWTGYTVTHHQEKFLRTSISKEGHAHIVLEHDWNHQYRFLWKECSWKFCFLSPTP